MTTMTTYLTGQDYPRRRTENQSTAKTQKSLGILAIQREKIVNYYYTTNIGVPSTSGPVVQIYYIIRG